MTAGGFNYFVIKKTHFEMFQTSEYIKNVKLKLELFVCLFVFDVSFETYLNTALTAVIHVNVYVHTGAF